ncbi:bifunctional diguanylate cyclase/phosphodiesterase [Lichenifustis flavocetrariae]|uniref:EAL domain-containing protein n=1 Tax=Lichenifustis flavocetrariae TaxID=2949735 RepID=A0AA42CPW5_9HYPH|nr:bifunctional diguanylate cyclase/phosphodiesterase [Lichenifustis flavocetrariae]MCW6510835.1 EAL domain-containing protein [Lichenifustis flavocetrariae]
MLKVVGCFVDFHDLRLVALAAFICAVASFTTIQLLCHARRADVRYRYSWISVAALAGGFGIWATHFIGMLAFTPGVPSGYNLSLTLLSLLYAILISGLGLGLARSQFPFSPWVGGATMGAGIAVMHYTGMMAFQVAGRIVWDPWLVSLSIVLGGLLGAMGCATAVKSQGVHHQILAAIWLLLAICGLHFTAMGAVTIIPDPAIEIAPAAMPSSWIAGAVALASLAILLFAAGALAIDLRDRRHAALEGARLRSLANAAAEGLVVCRGDRIVSANESFAHLVELPAGSVNGAKLSTFLPSLATRLTPTTLPDHPIEAELIAAHGQSIPVEIIIRAIDYASLPHFGVAVRDLRARRTAESKINFLALHDGLTGLANRTSFDKSFDRETQVAARTGGKLAVLCLDLDRFKEINDLFGHAAGDKVLQDLARITEDVLDDKQLMSRLGGDEFAILAPVRDAVGASRLAEQVLEALRIANQNGSGAQIATSIGIALYPDDGTDRAALLNNADTALYRVKSEGGGTYRFYESFMGADVRERRLIEHDLRLAVARSEIEVAYQPQAETGTGRITGFEALLRWRHPERGYVSPSTFIPIAEESGIIMNLGEWVLREACREAASWSQPLSVAVNVSAMQIHAAGFPATLQAALRDTGLSAGRLEIEITETALIRDPARALTTLHAIKELGVRIAMDDFGTGYSSLSNLRAFPFDRIKIDRSFIKSIDKDEQTAAIVRAVLSLGRGLKLLVTAEGVETDAELAFLQAEACHEVQGFLVARPAPIWTFAAVTHGHAASQKATAA